MAIPLLLHGKHAGPTVTYEPFGPCLVPWRVSSFEEEYRSLRTASGLIDYSHQALIEVQGSDRVSFLQNLLTNDIKQLSSGMGCRAALLTANAKLVSDLIVLAGAESHWLLCDMLRAATITETLNRYLFSEQVTITNRERQRAVLAVEGPRTIELLTQVVGAVVSLPSPGNHTKASLQDIPLWLIRHTLTGGIGVLCVVEADAAEAVWRLLQQRGRSVNLRLVGWEALNTARIEAGLPWFGVDMDETNLLPETGIERVTVSETKGCYLGQEIIARMQTYGSANKQFMGLLIDGDEVPVAGDRIQRDGEVVGQVTSACHSPTLRRPIAMGYLKRGSYEPGTVVEVLRGSVPLRATVAALPFVKNSP